MRGSLTRHRRSALAGHTQGASLPDGQKGDMNDTPPDLQCNQRGPEQKGKDCHDASDLAVNRRRRNNPYYRVQQTHANCPSTMHHVSRNARQERTNLPHHTRERDRDQPTGNICHLIAAYTG